MSNRTSNINQQAVFTSDGTLEPESDSVESSLEHFGAEVDHRERDSRLDQPAASEFGVDDRPEATGSTPSDQRALFAGTDDEQRTLAGERAAEQCLFDGSEQPPQLEGSEEAE